MTLHRLLVSCLFVAGCMQPGEPAPSPAPPAATSSELSLEPGVLKPPAPCPAVVCNYDGTCPTCNGVTPECDAFNGCHYITGGGGGGGGGGPACPAAVCNNDSDCASNCPTAPYHHCASGVCQYTVGNEDS